MTSHPTTISEMALVFEAHEERDVERDNSQRKLVETYSESILTTLNDIKVNHIAPIKTSVDYTNGKVAAIKKWQERMNGGMLVAGGFMLAVIVPLAGYVLYIQTTIQDTVRKEIKEETIQAVNDAFDARIRSITQ